MRPSVAKAAVDDFIKGIEADENNLVCHHVC
jgi:hypothetical protein